MPDIALLYLVAISMALLVIVLQGVAVVQTSAAMY